MKIIYDTNASSDLVIRFADEVSFDDIKKLLVRDWSAKPIEQLGTYDQGWLALSIEQGTITLHWDSFAGLCLISRDKTGEKALKRIGDYLLQK